jgi:[acyl-carrier-protein] S-malonyltransferase
MSLAFIFPGQGSQTVGMGRGLADAFPAARLVFEEVDEALGEALTKVIWEGPAETLVLTENAQPGLMAVSLAAMRVLETEAGVDLARDARFLDFEQAVTVAGEAAEDQVCQAANDNGGGQVVVSGDKAAVERAVEIAKGKGARRAMMLPVSAPFHCSLMQPAADAMATALAGVTVKSPVVPVVANVLAKPIRDPADIVGALVAQVTGTVRWRDSISFMADAGVTRFCEVGAGKVLSGLVKRIAEGAIGVSVGTPDDVAAFKTPRP